MKSLVHDKPRQRKTFAKHFQYFFVLGTSFEHYRTWIMWLKASLTTRVLYIVYNKNKYISNPSVSATDAVMTAAGNLAEAIKGKIPQNLKMSSLDKLERL